MGSMFRKYYILILALSFFGLAAACGGEGTTERITPSLDAPTPDRPAPPVEPLEKPATTADGIATEDAEFVEGEDLPEAGQDGLAKVTLSPFSRTREGEAVITLRVEPESPPADNSASEGKFLVATDHKTIERVLFDVTLLDRECYNQRTGRVDERGIGTTEQICKEAFSYEGYFSARYLSDYRGVRVSFGEAFNRWYRRYARTSGAGIDEDEYNLISFEVQLQFEDGTYSNRVYSPEIVLEDLEEFISEPIAQIGRYLPFRPFGGTSTVTIDFITGLEDTSLVFVEEDLTLNYSVAIYPDGAREPEDFRYKTFDVLSGDAIVEILDDVPRYKSYMVWSLLDGEGYKPIDRAFDGVDKVETGKLWGIDVSRNGICDYGCVVVSVVEKESDIPGDNGGNGDNGGGGNGDNGGGGNGDNGGGDNGGIFTFCVEEFNCFDSLPPVSGFRIDSRSSSASDCPSAGYSCEVSDFTDAITSSPSGCNLNNVYLNAGTGFQVCLFTVTPQ